MANVATKAPTDKKYMKSSEIITFGIGLFNWLDARLHNDLFCRLCI